MLRINLLTSINPAKLRDKINEIIHWMWRNELVPGHGIRIDRKVNGIIVSADPPVGGRSGNGAVSSESSGYCGEFKVSVGEIVRSEEEPGEIISLELFIRSGLYEGYDNTYPYAGWVLIAGKRVAKTEVYHGTLWKDNYNLSNIYVWHETYFHPVDGIRTTYVFTEEDKFPTEENGTYTVVYDLLAVIRDGKVIQAHYGPIHIMDRYYDETVTE